MSKKIEIDIEVNGKMTKATVDAKKLRGQLDDIDDAQKKTTKSSDKFQKGLKGVGDQSANASKNFSKFSSGMGGFVGVYASLAAQLFAISAAFNFLKRAGDLEALKAGQQAFASATGTAMRTLANDIQAATNAQITFQDAAQAGAIGVAAGLSADQLTRLGKAAADAGQVLGRDVTDSFNRLVRGVTKAEPELLDELGIILRLKDATEAYAEQLGKSASQLTQAEKSQAVVNDVLGQAERKYSAVLDVVGRTPNQFAQLGIAFDNIQNRIKEVISVVAGPLADVLTNTPLLAGAGFALLASGPLKAMGFSLQDVAQNARDSANIQLEELDKLKAKQIQLTNTKQKHTQELQRLSKIEVDDANTKSKILQRLSRGEKLIPVDKANLRKALKAAQAEIKEHGVITKGIFAGRDAAVLASFESTLDKMDTAMDQTASRWQKMTLRMSTAWTSFKATVQAGIASLTAFISGLIFYIGIAGIALTAYKTAIEFMKDRGIIAKEPAEELNKQAIIAEAAEKRIISLAEEYENFARVQTVLMETNTQYEVMTQNVGALAQMLSTVFAEDNIDSLVENLNNYSKETQALNEFRQARKDYADDMLDIQKRVEDLIALNPASGAGIMFRTLQGLSSDTLSVIEDVKGSLFELTYEGFAELRNVAIDTLSLKEKGFEKQITAMSKSAKAAEQNLINAKDGITALQTQLKELGVGQSFQVFNEFSSAITLLEKALDGDLSEEEFAKLKTTLAENVPIAQALAANVKALPDAAKATASAFAQLESSLLGSTQGDLVRKAGESELALNKAIADRANMDVKDFMGEEYYNRVTRQIQLGDAAAKEANRTKIVGLELQAEAIRNYAKISKAEGDILKKIDASNKAEATMNDLITKQSRVREMYTDEYGNVTDEAQRQLNLLQAQIDLEDARFDLLQEEIKFLKDNKDLFESQERMKAMMTILNYEKQIADVAQKTAQTQLNTAKLRAKTALDQSQERFEVRQVSNPFLTQSREAAKFELEQAQKRLAIESSFIQIELANKITQIDMEYKLLDAKNKQTIIEAKLLKARMAEKPTLFSPEDIAAVDNAISGLQNLDLTKQKEAMIENAVAQANRSEYELEKAVRNAALKLLSENPFFKLFNSAVSSFKTSLTDTINAAFTSLYDDTMKLSDALKDIGRSFLTQIQEAVTQFLIVEPLMDAMGSLFNKSTPGQKMAQAIKDAINDAEKGVKGQMEAGAEAIKTQMDAGSTVLKGKIEEALQTNKIKLQCCEQKAQPTPPPVPATTSTASETPYAGPQSLEARTSSSINAAFTESERASAGAEARAYASQQLAEGQAALGASLASPSSFADSIQAPTLLPVAEARTMQEEEGGGGLSEAMSNLRDSIGDLTIETASNITAGAALVAGLTGNSKAAEALAKVTAALKAYQMVKAGIEKFLGIKRTTETGMLITALAANTASNYAAAAGGVVPGFRYGGVAKPYSTGGIANGPNSGHLAMLHGKEAVVPLPNGNSIPVEMKNGGQSVNNVTVNVSTDGQTQSSSNGAMGENLGQVIAAAVQKELHNQKRAGGILNKHGAA